MRRKPSLRLLASIKVVGNQDWVAGHGTPASFIRRCLCEANFKQSRIVSNFEIPSFRPFRGVFPCHRKVHFIAPIAENPKGRTTL